KMVVDDKKLKPFSEWLVPFLVPFAILMIVVRVLITPAFAKIEYKMPGFPDDPFGFTLEDRLTWAEPSISYLVNTEGIEYLQALTFDDGTPIYNADELSHMEDVKTVVVWMRTVLSVLMLVLVLLTYSAVKKGRRLEMVAAFRWGAWATIGLIAIILIFVTVAFNNLFTWFHMLFFKSGTWMFYTSDTLIRLFPMRFWQDAFIAVGVLSVIVSVIILIATKPKSELTAKKAKSEPKPKMKKKSI
ncbi:MAG: TIGR01906 family membrane protein, partial [Anaerolineaceae bacterium]|nr:TIGR01906 family membrane protein [Anaerolineaceae bacterium]